MNTCTAIRLAARRAPMVVTGALLLMPATAAAQDAAKAEAGEQVYSTYCSTCHGDRLVSTGQTFDLRRLTAADRPRFESSVLNGKNQMPPWRGALNETEIDQIWHYIRSVNDRK
jgi:mono/diheme cytochrome c family protein